MEKLLSLLRGNWFGAAPEPKPVVDLDYKPKSTDVHAYCMELVLYYQGMAPHELQLFAPKQFPFIESTYAEFLALMVGVLDNGQRREYQPPPQFGVIPSTPEIYFRDANKCYLEPVVILERFAKIVEEFLSIALTEDQEGMYYATYRLNTTALAFNLVKLIKLLIESEQAG